MGSILSKRKGVSRVCALRSNLSAKTISTRFDGWMKYQGTDVSSLAEDELTLLRGEFEDSVRRRELTGQRSDA